MSINGDQLTQIYLQNGWKNGSFVWNETSPDCTGFFADMSKNGSERLRLCCECRLQCKNALTYVKRCTAKGKYVQTQTQKHWSMVMFNATLLLCSNVALNMSIDQY